MAKDDEGSTGLVDVRAILQEFGDAKHRTTEAYLVVLTGSQMGQHHRLEKAEYVVGRQEGTDITLKDEGISRKHARVYQDGDSYAIEDLGSANGTFLNAERIKTARLSNGDKIGVGAQTILRFTLNDSLDAEYQRKMHDAAVRDGATQAYNKVHFLHRLDTEFAYAARHGSDLSLLMFDIDHFKRINDTYGHLAGDHVLIELAKAVHAAVRVEDVFGRYGGEEFGVVSRGIGLEGATRLAERLRSTLERKVFNFQGQNIPVTVSLGVAVHPAIGVGSGRELLAAADGALYEAKRGGRNRYAVAARPR